MSTQTMSKIILTVILLLFLSMGCYWLSTNVLVYGLILTVGSIAGLLWLWKPWARFT